MSKSDSAGTTSYKRASVTDALLGSTVSSTTTHYTPGVSSRVGSDSTFMHSGIKNADTQTDDGGDISAMRQYDAFGNPVASSGTWQGPFGYGGPYGYQTDNDHALMLLGHRYYEPDTGRFLTRDPIKDGRNWYGYCKNGPLSKHDDRGLQGGSVSTPSGRLQLVKQLLEIAREEGTTITQQLYLHGGKLVKHHLLPKAFMQWFKDRGIYIDHYVSRIPEWYHKVLHRGQTHSLIDKILGRAPRGGYWNKEWALFIRENPKASKKQVEEFLRELLRKNGIEDLPIGN